MHLVAGRGQGNDVELAQRARAVGIAVEPLSQWYLEAQSRQGLGMGFTNVASAEQASTLALRLAQRYLPAHLFVYVFVNAFLAGGLSLIVAAASGMALLWLLGVYDWPYLLDNALPFYFLLSWSEAFTSGLVLSIMVVYRPQWVRSFDDSRYLAR